MDDGKQADRVTLDGLYPWSLHVGRMTLTLEGCMKTVDTARKRW